MSYALKDANIDLYEFYTTASSLDWDRFVSKQALKYYDELIAHYESVGDAAEVMRLKQEKVQIQDTLYNTLSEQIQHEADLIKEAWEEIRTAADNVDSSLSKFISSPDYWAKATNTELTTLKQNLMEVGYTAQ
jgi:hypothetical protein